MLKRCAIAATGIVVLAGCSKSRADLPVATVYKSPTCGCCVKWQEHMAYAGFTIEPTEMMNVTPIKDRLGVPGQLRSCHTAVVEGYVVEGHVPEDVVHKMLKERPAIAGIAVAGMPIGSPGMEGPNPQPYNVVAFTTDGSESAYASR
jgi:hypothetical protein